ncbi:MAG TPA: hypothetical protein VMV61_10315, partial [Patescibacteria group bacterium]|nr:hypothetical protein [Patescibacteria group bacterium]
MTLERLRRSDRISITIPVEIFGADFTGEHFVEKCKTVIVSRHGATIIVSRKLAPDLELILKRLGTPKEALVRVIGQIGGQHEGYVYGVALMDSNINLWNIYFPVLDESQSAVGRALLECGHCKNREIVYMNEVEAEVYEANLALQRNCNSCGNSTIWKSVPGELVEDPSVPAQPESTAPAAESGGATVEAPLPPAEPVVPVVSRRKDLRIKSNMPACIRQPGFDEEVVSCDDISRGGLAFRSSKRYFLGSR